MSFHPAGRERTAELGWAGLGWSGGRRPEKEDCCDYVQETRERERERDRTETKSRAGRKTVKRGKKRR